MTDRIFPSLPQDPQLLDLFRLFPHAVQPLLDYHDRLLRDESPLTVGERELIAAYVSGLNACDFCHGAHIIAASVHGIDEGLFAALMADAETGADRRTDEADSRLCPKADSDAGQDRAGRCAMRL